MGYCWALIHPGASLAAVLDRRGVPKGSSMQPPLSGQVVAGHGPGTTMVQNPQKRAPQPTISHMLGVRRYLAQKPQQRVEQGPTLRKQLSGRCWAGLQLMTAHSEVSTPKSHKRIYIYTHSYVYLYIYIYIYIYKCVCFCICIYAKMYMCIYACMYAGM